MAVTSVNIRREATIKKPKPSSNRMDAVSKLLRRVIVLSGEMESPS
jgi:hypothetical protein